jgi:hypothetical protein
MVLQTSSDGAALVYFSFKGVRAFMAKLQHWEGYLFLVVGCPCSSNDKAYIFAKDYEAAITVWLERCADRQQDGGCGCDYTPAAVSIVASMDQIETDHDMAQFIGAAMGALHAAQSVSDDSGGCDNPKDEITADHMADFYAKTVEETRGGCRKLLQALQRNSDNVEVKLALGEAIDLLV